MIQYIKSGSAGERAGKGAKTTGKSNSFREKKKKGRTGISRNELSGWKATYTK